MTHTLHRRGLSDERPGEEIVFLAMIPASMRGKKSEEMTRIARTVHGLSEGRDDELPSFYSHIGRLAGVLLKFGVAPATDARGTPVAEVVGPHGAIQCRTGVEFLAPDQGLGAR